jgi:hypothetical protein
LQKKDNHTGCSKQRDTLQCAITVCTLLHPDLQRPEISWKRQASVALPLAASPQLANQTWRFAFFPGTEIAFEQEVEYRRGLGFFMTGKVRAKTARFRQVDKATPTMHHDALEFPDGQTVLLTRLCDGQRATVLQLPAASRVGSEAEEQKSVELSLTWSRPRGVTRYRLSSVAKRQVMTLGGDERANAKLAFPRSFM